MNSILVLKPGSSKQDAIDWYRELIHHYRVALHPDDNPETYCDKNSGVPAFTYEESKVLKESITQLFKDHGSDSYEIALIASRY